MAWMATRDIYTSLVLTAVFIILSDNLFNEESNYCVVPEYYRVMSKLVDTNEDNNITQEEIDKAKDTLLKAEQQTKKNNQKEHFTKFHDYLYKY